MTHWIKYTVDLLCKDNGVPPRGSLSLVDFMHRYMQTLCIYRVIVYP